MIFRIWVGFKKAILMAEAVDFWWTVGTMNLFCSNNLRYRRGNPYLWMATMNTVFFSKTAPSKATGWNFRCTMILAQQRYGRWSVDRCIIFFAVVPTMLTASLDPEYHKLQSHDVLWRNCTYSVNRFISSSAKHEFWSSRRVPETAFNFYKDG